MGNTKNKRLSAKQRILDAATLLFLRDGFSQTSLDTVAEQAETTKPTVYSHFNSKQGLFNAIICNNIEDVTPLVEGLLKPTEDPKADLLKFGDKFLPFVLSEETQRWDRLAASEAINHPEIGDAFFEAGPARALKQLAAYLKAQASAGRLNIRKSDRAAEHLLGLMLGLEGLRIQVGKQAPAKAAIKRRCREAVDVFLAFYGNDQ
jgi:TetR/AcrR family transcriptional repressor of mexJK operon